MQKWLLLATPLSALTTAYWTTWREPALQLWMPPFMVSSDLNAALTQFRAAYPMEGAMVAKARLASESTPFGGAAGAKLGRIIGRKLGKGTAAIRGGRGILLVTSAATTGFAVGAMLIPELLLPYAFGHSRNVELSHANRMFQTFYVMQQTPASPVKSPA